MQVSTTWALTCPETVHQRPCITREMETSGQVQWRRNYGDKGVHCIPQVQDLYPLYLPSQRCGLCQNFKQTTLTTRFYKVRTNLYPHLRKRSDAPVSIYTADKKLRLLHKTPTENLPAGSQNLSAPSGCICRPRGQSTRRSFWVFVHPQFVVLATRNCALHH